MRSWPIWNDVTNCAYQSGKSYGNRDTGEVTVRVGTSASNSEVLVRHCVTRRMEGNYTIFRFFVDTGDGYERIAKKWMHTKTKAWFDNEPPELQEVAA